MKNVQSFKNSSQINSIKQSKQKSLNSNSNNIEDEKNSINNNN